MSLPTWTAYDEGYLRAHQWARALAGGTRMPQVTTTTRLGPGEVVHARIGPVSVVAYFGEDVDYRPSLFLVGGPVGLAVTGAASIARNQAKKAEAQQAATPRWHRLGTAEVQVTNQRMVVTGSGRTGSFWYAELSPLQLVAGGAASPARSSSRTASRWCCSNRRGRRCSTCSCTTPWTGAHRRSRCRRDCSNGRRRKAACVSSRVARHSRSAASPWPGHNGAMDTAALRARIERHIRRHDLIAPGGAVTCFVSGGADSTCLWHALRELGYQVSALHVNHGLRGEESDEDARFCRETLGAEVIDASNKLQLGKEADLRELRYSFAQDRLRATGHTASDQVETVLYRLVASGSTRGIKPRREDGVVRPLLTVWREETEAYCKQEGVEYRVDSSNPDTKRGLIRSEILPLLERLHPGARRNLLRLAGEPPRLPRQLEETLAALLETTEGSATRRPGTRPPRRPGVRRGDARARLRPLRPMANRDRARRP